MQFRKTTTISIGEKTKPIYESFEKIRPNHISFSLFLALAVEEYVETHKKVTNEKYPRLMGRIDAWDQCITKIENDELIAIQNRIHQLSNKVRKEIGRRL